MSAAARHSLSRWKFRHAVVVLIGIGLNLIFCVPLLLFPDATLKFFGVPHELTTFWPRFAGGLIILISVFYLPAIIDIDRYRLVAWLAILPSRAFGALFLLTAVLLLGFAGAFLIPAAIDAGIAVASLYCLIKITQSEDNIANGRVQS